MISSDIYHKGSVMLDDFQEKFGWNYYSTILDIFKEESTGKNLLPKLKDSLNLIVLSIIYNVNKVKDGKSHWMISEMLHPSFH